MTYYVTTDGNEITGVFSEKRGNVPQAAVPISDEDFATLRDHPDGFGMFDLVDGAVVINGARVLALYKYRHLQTLRQACKRHILAGFTSDALGATHRYPAKQEDQLNLSGCVTEAILEADNAAWTVPFWCADANGAWARRTHTGAQIQQVGKDGAAHVRAAQTKLASLMAQVQAAGTQAEVDQVTW